MSTRKIHDRVCEICGVSFKGGKFSHVCDECRAKSRKGRAKNLRRDKADSALGFEKMMESYLRVNKEPLPKYETCPNFNPDDLSCVLCGYDEWKFKKCGEKKK